MEQVGQLWLHPAVEVFDSPIQGRGLRTNGALAAGTWVARYGGILVTDAELETLFATSATYVDTLSLAPDRNLVLPQGSPNGYGNHGCDPNLWWCDPLGLKARRDIAAGQELTLDYASITDDPDWSMVCTCGSDWCRGTITGLDWQRGDLQRRLGQHWVPVLRARIAGQRRDPDL